jgi:hypothetical protein
MYQELAVPAVGAITGALITNLYGPVRGSLAIGGVLMFARLCGVEFGIHCKLDNESIALHVLTPIDLTLDDPTFRTPNVYIASAVVTAGFASVPTPSVLGHLGFVCFWIFLCAVSSPGLFFLMVSTSLCVFLFSRLGWAQVARDALIRLGRGE